MTRDEFVTRCDGLSSETKYSSKPWHIWLAEMTAHDAEQRAEIARLRTLCLEAYQVVGSLATDAGMFDHQATVRVLDNLSMAGTGKPLPHRELLPYPASQKIARLREALEKVLIHKDHMERELRGYGTPEEEALKKSKWLESRQAIKESSK